MVGSIFGNSTVPLEDVATVCLAQLRDLRDLESWSVNLAQHRALSTLKKHH